MSLFEILSSKQAVHHASYKIRYAYQLFNTSLWTFLCTWRKSICPQHFVSNAELLFYELIRAYCRVLFGEQATQLPEFFLWDSLAIESTAIVPRVLEDVRHDTRKKSLRVWMKQQRACWLIRSDSSSIHPCLKTYTKKDTKSFATSVCPTYHVGWVSPCPETALPHIPHLEPSRWPSPHSPVKFPNSETPMLLATDLQKTLQLYLQSLKTTNKNKANSHRVHPPR